jgi:phenylpropionate dioxygenase-like ring-hydroxylating dioxygenase large terminal subunit
MSSPADRRPAFPTFPTGWFYACPASALRAGPVAIDVGEKKFVAFRGADGKPAVLDARCSHLGANLALGYVAAGMLHCPLHDWQYGSDGKCIKIPAGCGAIPPFAVQTSFPTTEVGGDVVFFNSPVFNSPVFNSSVFNSPVAAYPFPFYEDRKPDDLLAARPFEFVVEVPWYMVAANAFDLQHFRVAHDRTIVGEPVIESPSPFARKITADYDVVGTSFQDRVTRRLSGPRVNMSITSWAGLNILVTARFRRTTSYGMVFVRPIDEQRTHLRTIVWVPRRAGAIARAAIDPLDAAIRRRFIRAFMKDDVVRSAGIRYNPATLIEADRELGNYLKWLLELGNT